MMVMRVLKAFYIIITSTMSVAFVLKLLDTKGVFHTEELLCLSFLILICFAHVIEGITMGIKTPSEQVK